MSHLRIAAFGIVFFGFASLSSASLTYFAYDSSPSSWVGQGRTNYYVSPETGWTFTPGNSRPGSNTVGFDVRDTDPNAPTSDYYWFFTFAAPAGEALEVGLYTDAQRWPFNAAGHPGLQFGGNHRLDNAAGGFFEVLEIEYGDDGALERFSVDFTHYGEGDPNRWAVGELRYNATVPEPSLAGVAATGCGLLCLRRRRRRVSCPAA